MITFSLDVHKGNRKENSHFSSALLQKLVFIHCCKNCPFNKNVAKLCLSTPWRHL